MSSNKPKSLFDHFRVIEDIRDEKKRRHLLIEMLVIAITAVICGADGWTQVEAFGKSREAWFRGFLRLPNGNRLAPPAELDRESAQLRDRQVARQSSSDVRG